MELYIPSDRVVYVDSIPTRPLQSTELPTYAKAAQRNSNFDYSRPEQIHSSDNHENIINLNNNGKMINNFDLQIREDDLNSRQGNFSQLLFLYVVQSIFVSG